MATTRRDEMEAAAACLDVELDWIGLPEGEWRPADLEGRLGQVIGRFRPDIIYAPSRIDFHPEHLKVARALARSLNAADSRQPAPELRIYGVQVPLTPLLANLVVEVGRSEGRLHDALAAHRSQRPSLDPCLRHRRYLGQLYGLAGAEEFWRLTAEQYERLHRDANARPPERAFRGLRYYAWSDPLAYLRGLEERRRSARLVG